MISVIIYGLLKKLTMPLPKISIIDKEVLAPQVIEHITDSLDFSALNSVLITAELIGRFYLSHQEFLPWLLTVISQQEM